MASETRECQNCNRSFVIEPEDFSFYERIKVPPPTWCPECRMIRRMTWRNERNLYRIACGLCGKSIISLYPPESGVKVYCSQCWFSDKWDASNINLDYDFSRPFFSQWHDLFMKAPLIAIWSIRGNVNSEYCSYAADNKNCYLSSSVLWSENVSYSYSVDRDRDCIDCAFLNDSELCYENLNGANNYRSVFLIQSRNCLDSSFLFDCVNCQNCFLSWNLRNKRFVFRNQQLDEASYKEKLKEFEMGSSANLVRLFDEFTKISKEKALHRYANIIKSQKATGDNIENSKNVKEVFEAYEDENAFYGVRVFKDKDVVDAIGVVGSELGYELIAPGLASYMSLFVMLNDSCREVSFTNYCFNCSNCFACIGLKNKQYCILNKQYTKEEYESLVPRIIAHMNDMPYIDKKGRVYRYGEFFPPELSPFAYNETIAQEYFPLTKGEAIEKGYRWKEPEEKKYEITILNDRIPDNIKDVRDDIVNEVIECAHKGECNEHCTQAFKMTPPEVQFYKRMNLPLPRLCPNCRHYQRLRRRNPLRLWHRKCACAGAKSNNGSYMNTISHQHGAGKCPNEFETSYAPERKEIVYCESCYNTEVV